MLEPEIRGGEEIQGVKRTENEAAWLSGPWWSLLVVRMLKYNSWVVYGSGKKIRNLAISFYGHF